MTFERPKEIVCPWCKGVHQVARSAANVVEPPTFVKVFGECPVAGEIMVTYQRRGKYEGWVF